MTEPRPFISFFWIVAIMLVILSSSIVFVGLWLTRGHDVGAPEVETRSAPSIASVKEDLDRAEQEGNQLASDIYRLAGEIHELEDQTERLEQENAELCKVLYFVDCLEKKTGGRFSPAKNGKKPASSGTRHFEPKMLESAAADTCRKLTLETAKAPDFSETCDRLIAQRHPG